MLVWSVLICTVGSYSIMNSFVCYPHLFYISWHDCIPAVVIVMK